MAYHTFINYFVDENGNRRAGARAIEPPPDTGHAVRGNLYAVLELLRVSSTDDQTGRAHATLYAEPDAARVSEHLLAGVQSTYYSARGSQSEVLTQAIGRVAETLRTINEQRPQAPIYAGITCAAFLNGVITIASSGPSLALIATGGNFEQFPSSTSAAHLDPPRQMLGGAVDVSVKNYRRLLQARGVFFLGGSMWLERVPVRKLLGAIAHSDRENMHDVVSYLSQESGDVHLPGLLVVLESDAEGGDPAGLRDSTPPASQQNQSGFTFAQGQAQHSPVLQPAARSRRAGGGLPTAVHATPPVHTVPAAAEGTSGQWQAPPTPRRGTGVPADVYSVGTNAAWPPSMPPPSAGQPPEDRQAFGAQIPSTHVAYLQPDAVRVGEERDESAAGAGADAQQSGLWDSARDSLLGAWGFLTTMLPERRRESATKEGDDAPAHVGDASGQPDSDIYGRSFVSAAPATDEGYDTHSDAAVPNMASQEATMSSGMPVAAGAQQALSDSWARIRSFTPPAPASGSRARLFIALSIAILVLIPIIVAAVVWQRGASLRAEGEILVSAAQANVNSADSALDLGDKATARAELTKAQENLAEAVVLIGNTPAINELLQQIERDLQEVLQVSPLYGLVEPLARFPLEASPRQLLIVDQDIYVLDQGRHLVQRFHLDADRQMVADPDGEIVLQRGDVIDGVTVGSLIDITWQEPIPGIEDRSSLLVLDGNNNIFRYNQRVEGATMVVLAEQDAWQSPTQIKSYLGRLYVADSGRGQIYRYDPGAYEVAPQPWLLAPTDQGLAGLQTMMIEGDIWLLFSNGLLLRYSQGQQVPFALANDVGLVSEPVDIFVGDQDSSSIYLADAGQERILVFGKEGAYKRQLQAAEDHPLRDLRGIYVDEVEGIIYILTKSSLFQHPLPQ